ncbi:aromatic prenyltransferase [Streptomyces sp. NPDC058739]|uniref:aromatic prenyltransferase n=1 Tax=Streptomyces sp. NPDC058739 TaxID=3346618 RepID=UPI0036A885EE
MTESVDVETVYTAIEEAAALLGLTPSPDTVRAVLKAFEPFEGGIIFSASAGEGHAGDLDLTVQVPEAIADPYAHALACGLVPRTDHPVSTLLADLRERCRVDEYLIDFAVIGGFNKIYVHFPHDPQSVEALAAVPSMPRALADNAGLFARHGLDRVAMLAIDYTDRTVNPYFTFPAGLSADTVTGIVRDLGLPDPDEELARSARKTFRAYPTLGWDSSRIERIGFARALDLPVVRSRVEPEIVRFVTGTPYTYDGERFSISIVKWSPEGQWFNVGSYYRFGPLQREVLGRIQR